MDRLFNSFVTLEGIFHCLGDQLGIGRWEA